MHLPNNTDLVLVCSVGVLSSLVVTPYIRYLFFGTPQKTIFGGTLGTAMPKAAKSKFAILITGNVDEVLAKQYGDFGDMFIKLLKDSDDETWDRHYCFQRDPPSDEVLQGYQALVVTGSAANSFDKDDWIMKLQDRLEAALARKQTVLGVCFGHQLISIVLGGQTGRATAFEGGSRTILPTSAFHKHWLSEGIAASWDFRIHQTHSDAVLEMPPDVQLLGTSNNTHVEMIAQGDHFLGVQGHPEFTADFQRALLKHRVEAGTLTKEQADASTAEMDSNPVNKQDFERIQLLLKRFIRRKY